MDDIRPIDANALKEQIENRAQNIVEIRLDGKCFFTVDEILCLIDNAPTVEITEKQAINKLYETGWLIKMAEAYDDLLKKIGGTTTVEGNEDRQIVG